MLRGQRILLGVTGGIAAYKTTFLVRLFRKAGAEVKVVLSPEARDFVTPLTLATLSENPVYWSYFAEDDPSGQWHNHVELGLWADLMLIAPATAHTLAKMAQAQSDNFLLGVYLSAKCPVYFAPAMDRDMYRHPGNQTNIERLQEYGHVLIPAETGPLASGLEGQGRMAEPEHILEQLEAHLREQQPLVGRRVLITGGPTHEPLDPVRFLGNRSSGKTAIALAEAALARGAEVDLVLGPTHLSPASASDYLHLHRVETAEEMLSAAEKCFAAAHLSIFAAAVSDYRPEKPEDQKIKKTEEALQLQLQPNPDILKTLAGTKSPGQCVVGFALETQNAENHGRQKLKTKNCDLIIVNSPDDSARGFGHDTNEWIILDRHGQRRATALQSKQQLAHEILDFILDRGYI